MRKRKTFILLTITILLLNNSPFIVAAKDVGNVKGISTFDDGTEVERDTVVDKGSNDVTNSIDSDIESTHKNEQVDSDLSTSINDNDPGSTEGTEEEEEWIDEEEISTETKSSTQITQSETIPYELGMDNANILEAKKKLNRLGFDGLSVDTGYYDQHTEKRVKEFQTYYGLKINGMMDQATLKKMDEIIAHPLQNGKKHDDLNQLKQKLNRIGYSGIKISPNFGSFTEKRVNAFQRDHKLPVSGIIEDVTKAKIDDVFQSTYQEGSRHKGVTQLKRDLNRLGFSGLIISNLYGSFTTKRVKEFQQHYGLQATGKADLDTLNKIDEILSSSLQLGKRNNATLTLKKKLNALGYGGLKVTEKFGSFTEKRVKEFQKDFQLPISGIVDEITRTKIQQATGKKEVITYQKYDVTLQQSLNIQMNKNPQTDKYRNRKAYVHSDYIDFIGLTSGKRSNLRTSPSSSSTKNIRYTVDKGTKVTIKKEIKNGSSTWYEVIYKNETLYVHSSMLSPSTTRGRTTARLNVRAEANANSHIYKVLAPHSEVTILNKDKTWFEISLPAWRNPTRSDVQQFLDPNKNDKFQHLVLSSSVGVSASELNKVLTGKGNLAGLGQAFIDGGKVHSINEVYLISHALLETGHGISKLAKGIEVGKNKAGKLVVVTSSNRKKLTEIKTTYNMFGIGATDADPNRLGAIRAYEEKWFTPKAAIIGGAKFIGDRYIHNVYNQDTLYKMRWNPASPGFPQYATDIGWAVKQTTQIKNMYNQLSNPFLHFDIPQYK